MLTYTKVSGPAWANVSPSGQVTLLSNQPSTGVLTVQVSNGLSSWTKAITVSALQPSSQQYYSVILPNSPGLLYTLDVEIVEPELPSLAVSHSLSSTVSRTAALIDKVNLAFSLEADFTQTGGGGRR